MIFEGGKFRISIDWMAVICLIIPTFISVIYYGFLASDVYISESRFVVRESDKPTTTGLGLILKGIGFSNSGDELLATRDYIMSRDALASINTKEKFENSYSEKYIDIFNRFNPTGLHGTFEDLYEYYQGKVDVIQDSSTGIAVLSVRAYSPKVAFEFNKLLLRMAEAKVNEMNERGRADLVQDAIKEVADAKRRSWDADIALARYRNRHKLGDPKEESSAALQLVSKLQDELISTRGQLDQLDAFAPKNPQIPVLRQRERAIVAEIDRQTSKIAGDENSLAATSVEYQRLLQESTFAQNQLTAAMASLEQARNEAARKQAYVETIARPNEPDSALEPRRMRGIFTTFILGLVAWGIGRMLIAGILEHRE